MRIKSKKIVLPIIFFIFLVSMIVIKVALPSYAIDPLNIDLINNTCNNNITSIEEAYINDDNGQVNFGNIGNISVQTTGVNQYSVKMLLSFNSNKKEVDITLKDGIKWISWDNETTSSSIIKNVISEEYKTYQTKNQVYKIESGKKKFIIKDDIVCASLNFVISADMPLRIENITEAIKVEQKYIENNEEKTNTKTLDLKIDYSAVPIKLTGHNVDNITGSSIKGEKNFYPTSRLIGVYIDYLPPKLIYKNFEVEIETPLNTNFIEYHYGGGSYAVGALAKGWEEYELKQQSNNQIYKFIYKNEYGAMIGINPVWDLSKVLTEDEIKEGKKIEIKVKSLKYQLYDNKEIIYKFNDSTCVEEDTSLKKVICSNDTYQQKYKIINEEKISLNNQITINGFNKNYPNEIIRLGNFNIQNSGITSKEKIVNIKFDSTSVGVTHISLPSVLNTRITDLKYKLEGSNEWIKNFDESLLKDPDPMSNSYSTTLGYVNFTNEMVDSDKFITEVEYTIGKIPTNALTGYSGGVLSYSGILKKQNDGYPNKYNANISMRNLDGSDLIEGISETTVENINYLTSCPINTMNTTTITPGQTKILEYMLRQCNEGGLVKVTTMYEPIIYIRLPKNIDINYDQIIIESYQQDSNMKQVRNLINDYKIKKLENDHLNIYKIELEKNKLSFIGYPKYSQYAKIPSYLNLKFEIEIPSFYSDNGEKYLYNEIVFLTDGSIDESASTYIIGSSGSTGDKYDVDGDGKTDDLMTYGKINSDYFQVKTTPDINSYLSIKTSDEETEEIVIIKESANVNAKIVNNSGIDNQKGQMYIPIPRKGEHWKELMYCDENEECNKYLYNLYLEDLIKEKDTNKYKIYYGKNIKPINKYNDLMNIEKWYSHNEMKNLTKEELKEINLIKIDILDIDRNEEINVEFNLYSDERNTKEIIYNNISSAYYRNLKNAEEDIMTGWKKSNFINIGLGLSEEIIEAPITSNHVSIIVIIISILAMSFGIYLIVKNKRIKMD